MQVNNFNRYDRWQQLDALQAYLNKIWPSWELPEGYNSPVSYATADYLENYALKNKGGRWSIFDTTIDHYGGYVGYVQWMQKRRKVAIEQLLAEMKVEGVTLDNSFLNKPCLQSIYAQIGKSTKFQEYIQNFEEDFSVKLYHGLDLTRRIL